VTSWQAVLTAALIGSERSVIPALPHGFPAHPEPAAADPAAALLDRAALLTAARRAGYLTDQATPPAAAPPDPRPPVCEPAAQRLERILAGDPAGSGGSELLSEWLTAVIARGLRPPAQLLPALLHKTRQLSADDTRLRALLTAAGGPRAQWLAALNPAWARLLADPVPDIAAAPGPAPASPVLPSPVLPRAVPPTLLLSNLPPSYRPGAYLSAAQLADVLATGMKEISRQPLGAQRLIRLAGLWADPALGAPGALADFPPEAPNVLHNMLAVLRFRYEMLKELDDGHPDR
jgi:uncharacterized protein DUF5691